MTVSDKELWDLIHARHYAKALEILNDRQGVENYNPQITAASRSTVLICLGRFAEAAKAARQADEFHKEVPWKPGSAYLGLIGTAEWLDGRREEAAAIWQSAVRGILDRTIGYADSAGGVSQGLLLWFAGHELGRDALATEAEKFLANRLKRKQSESWPGPLATLVLGRKSSDSVMNEFLEGRIASHRSMTFADEFKNPSLRDHRIAKAEHVFDRWKNTLDVSVVIHASSHDVRLRRELCNFLFYDAVRKRIEGKATESASALQHCAGLEDVIMENEWFLAKALAAN
jgi:tetratricopeptide (TPR) repeat protein